MNDETELVVVFKLLQLWSHRGVRRNLIVGLFNPASPKPAYVNEVLDLRPQQRHPNKPCLFLTAYPQLGWAARPPRKY